MTITPAVGRIVLVNSTQWPGEDKPGIVTKVFSETCINVTVFAESGVHLHSSSVMTEDFENSGQPYGWHWMPYQKQVAEAAAPAK